RAAYRPGLRVRQNGRMRLSRLVEISRQVAATPSRRQKRALLAECLREAGPGLAPVVVSYLSGTLPQGRIGLGWRAVSDLGATASPAATGADDAARLTVAEVDEAFRQLAATTGKGSQQARRERMAALFARADAEER